LCIPSTKGASSAEPIYTGDSNSHQSTELLIQQIKDFRRSLDYLETRRDIDSARIAYCGMSQGAWIGPIILAVEPRLRAGILLAGGLVDVGRPEVKQINYVTRVRIPTLMLNGRYERSLSERRWPGWIGTSGRCGSDAPSPRS
jgi:predicted esterase